MSVRTFEQLVMACNAPRRCLWRCSIRRKRCLRRWLVTGTPTSITSSATIKAIRSLPFMRPQTARLMVSLGVPEHKVEETVIRRGIEGSHDSDA